MSEKEHHTAYEAARFEEKRKRKRTFLHSMNNAVEGFVHVVRSERNMRIHFAVATLVLLLAAFFGVKRIDWLLLVGATCLVLMAEMINTAIEETLNLLHSRYHPKVGMIKDISAGMVLVSVVNALIIGFFVFSQYWFTPFEFAVFRLRHAASYVLFLSLMLVIILVIYGKAFGKKGTPFQGGIVSGHAATAFSLWTVLVFTQSNLFVDAVGFLLAALVAQSRLRAKIHTYWEVVAGALLGTIVTAFLFRIFHS
jgi:diacylglycerol kinase (ATP)